MVSSVLLSTLLMGLVLIAIVVGILRFRQWQRAPTVGSSTDLLRRSVRSPAVWTAAFIALALGFGLGVVAIVSGASIPLPENFGVLLAAFLAPFLILLGLYMFAGIYSSARDRGLSNAPAAGLASAAIGFLVLVTIVVMLLAGGA